MLITVSNPRCSGKQHNSQNIYMYLQRFCLRPYFSVVIFSLDPCKYKICYSPFYLRNTMLSLTGPRPGSLVDIGERVGVLTWWLWVRYLVEVNFLSGVFSPPTSAEACEKTSLWLWKKKLCLHWYEKARKHMCAINRHDMTLAVKEALNPNTTNNQSFNWKHNF